MPDPGTTSTDSVQPVRGPDGNLYRFPKGTTKPQAIEYFRKKGIMGTAAPKPAVQSQAPTTDQTAPGAYKPGEKPSPLSRISEIVLGTPHPIDYEVRGEIPELIHHPERYLQNLMMMPVRMADQAVYHPINTLESLGGGQQSVEDFKKKNYGALAGDVAGGFVNLATLGKGAKSLPEAGEKLAASAPDLGKFYGNVKLAFNRAKVAEFENDFVHAKGLDVAKQFKDAQSNVNKEVERHTKVLQGAIAPDAIDAAQQLKDAQQAVDDVVKTPQAYPAPLRQMSAWIKQHTGGKWDFETSKQFRSAVGDAAANATGPIKAALSRIYVDMTDKMSQAAKDAGAEFSWDHYNELEKKFKQQSGDLTTDVANSQSGAEVAKRLLTDRAATKETVNNLSKYGLNSKEVNKFLGRVSSIIENKKSLGGTLRSMLYRSSLGSTTLIGAMAAGVPWRQALAPAVIAGLSQALVKTYRDIIALDPEVIRRYAKAREFPGESPTGAPFPKTPPAGATPSGGTPTPTPTPTPTAPGGATTKLTPLTPSENAALRAARQQSEAAPPAASGTQPSPTEKTATPVESASPSKAAKQVPEVKKIPEGQTGPKVRAQGGQAASLAQKAADRIRKAAEREKAKAELVTEATAGKLTTMPTVEIEDHLKSLGKGGNVLYSALQKMKRSEAWDEGTYRAYLIESLYNAVVGKKAD